MDRNEVESLLAVVVAMLVAVGMAWAGSQGGVNLGTIPVFALLAALAFTVQWAAFVFAFRMQTEHFYDLTGSLTYISIMILAVLLSPNPDVRCYLLLAMVLLWAGRLGSFLFARIRRAGKDGRFDHIKPSFLRFLNAWTLQGLWVILTSGAALAAITSGDRKTIGVIAILGVLVWLFGFTIEIVADKQKNRFRADANNKGQFIQHGLWAWSRHPNYFGEIVLWVGVALIAFPVLRGWQYVTLISPVFVAFLLTRVSGVPMLESRADEKWGGQPDYEAYKARTSILILRPPKSM